MEGGGGGGGGDWMRLLHLPLTTTGERTVDLFFFHLGVIRLYGHRIYTCTCDMEIEKPMN